MKESVDEILKKIKNKEEIERILTPQKIEELSLYGDDLEKLIVATGNIEKYLMPETVKAFELTSLLTSLNIANLIKSTGNVEKYLTPESVLYTMICAFRR